MCPNTHEGAPVTVEELDKLFVTHKRLDDEADAISRTLTEKNKEKSAIEFRIMAYLQELGRTGYVAPDGYKAEIVETWQVRMPADGVPKATFFEYLKERGIFEQYASVYSASLNALYRAEWQAAKDRGEGMTFSMPGIEAPVLEQRCRIKPPRKS